MVEKSNEPTGLEAGQRGSQERQEQRSDEAHPPGRAPGLEPSSTAEMPDSAAAVLDRLREVAAARDRD